jgi:GNAT superfamily N-acetyltransferase
MGISYLEHDLDPPIANEWAQRLVQGAPREHVHVVDRPWRLSSWAWSIPGQTRFWSTHDGEVRAWACLQTPFWSLDIGVHPDAEKSLLTDVLRWANDRAQALVSTDLGRTMWFAHAFSDQARAIAALEAAGFEPQADTPQPWSMVLMRHDPATAPAPASLPGGFTLRPLNGPSESAAYTALHRAVFNSDSMTEQWRRTVLNDPLYNPELDLVITDPYGRLAALCVGWLAATGPDGHASGQIGPLGVDARYRGVGLGRAIGDECVRPMYAKGRPRRLRGNRLTPKRRPRTVRIHRVRRPAHHPCLPQGLPGDSVTMIS